MPKNIEFQSHRFLDQWVFKLSPQYKGYVTPTCCQIDIDRVEQVFVFTSHLFSRWMNDIGPIYLCSQSCPGSLKEVRLGLFFSTFCKRHNRKMYIEEKPLGFYICMNTPWP